MAYGDYDVDNDLDLLVSNSGVIAPNKPSYFVIMKTTKQLSTRKS